MDVKTLRVESWAELMDALYLDSYNAFLHRYRSSYVYRGMEDADDTLHTTLNRLGESHLEKHLLRNFIKYGQSESDFGSIWNWMALAQHHGLPTRFLDWTYSPLVALHFATANFMNYEKDGIIYALNYVDAKIYLPPELASIIEEEGSHIFTAEMLDRAVNNLPQLEALQKEPFALFFEPPSINPRIVNQYAIFSMMSDPSVVVSDWLPGRQVRAFRIIIPSKLKWEIRDKLDQSNINERVLFPGLDGLARWLKRHYWDIRATS